MQSKMWMPNHLALPNLNRQRACSHLPRVFTPHPKSRAPTSSVPVPPRRASLALSLSTSSTVTKCYSSLSGPRTSSTPMSPRAGTPLSFPVRYGRTAISTALPKLVALVETPDVAIGAVDPLKRRVVASTCFSARTDTDHRVYGLSAFCRC